MKLLFCTANQNKFREVQASLPPAFELLSLSDIRFSDEIPEPFDTIAENSSYKAQFVYEHTKLDCFAEDTGLCVDALSGAPGVYSARFAGPQATDSENVTKLLQKMQGLANRRASFLTILSFISKGQLYQFRGELKGFITEEAVGLGGFGYDPVFRPEGSDLTLAEIGFEEKIKISHRRRALDLFIDFLKKASF